MKHRVRATLLGIIFLLSALCALTGCSKSGEDNPGKNDNPQQKAARENKKGD